MISMDLTVAASTFLIFLIYKFKTKKLIQLIHSVLIYGWFSLALPLYLYDNYEKF